MNTLARSREEAGRRLYHIGHGRVHGEPVEGERYGLNTLARSRQEAGRRFYHIGHGRVHGELVGTFPASGPLTRVIGGVLVPADRLGTKREPASLRLLRTMIPIRDGNGGNVPDDYGGRDGGLPRSSVCVHGQLLIHHLSGSRGALQSPNKLCLLTRLASARHPLPWGEDIIYCIGENGTGLRILFLVFSSAPSLATSVTNSCQPGSAYIAARRRSRSP